MSTNTPPSEAQALEIEAHETLRTLRCGLDDLSATLERLRQLRQRDDDSDPRLIVEETNCNRWEVACD
jgi:hypothetical protein